jgi:hypothetical protein
MTQIGESLKMKFWGEELRPAEALETQFLRIRPSKRH